MTRHFGLSHYQTAKICYRVRGACITVAVLFVAWLTISICMQLAFGKEGDNHGNHGDLKAWFNQLASKKGLCCSFADGVEMKDVDWDTQDGHYRVRIDGEWITVPDAAVIEEPNRYGPAVVWPYESAYEPNGQGKDGHTFIRCFMPGALT